MGFWGVKILARTDRELGGLVSVKDLDGDLAGEASLDNGWRVATVHRGQAGDDKLLVLVAETGAPVLLAEVAASDFAVVAFAGPDRAIGRFVLHPRSAEGYQCPVDPSDQEAAPAALAGWAGAEASESDVATAVGGEMVFAEDSFMRLAGALGAFPLNDLEHYIFGPMPDAS